LEADLCYASAGDVTKKTAIKNLVESANEIVAGHPSADAINRVRQLIRDAVPAASEGVKWNAPSFSTEDHFATFFLGGKRRVPGFQVILHLGAKPRPDADLPSRISDPTSLLEWRSADRAIVSFHDESDVVAKETAFREIVRAWASFVRA
jgi:hypothetical protein